MRKLNYRSSTILNLKRHILSLEAKHLFILRQDNCTNVGKKLNFCQAMKFWQSNNLCEQNWNWTPTQRYSSKHPNIWGKTVWIKKIITAFLQIRSNLSPKHSFKALLSSCLFVFRFDRSGSGSKIRFCWMCPDAIINRCSCKFPLY